MEVTTQHSVLVSSVTDRSQELMAVTNTIRQAILALNKQNNDSVDISNVRSQELLVYGHVPNGGQIAFAELYALAIAGQQRHLDDLIQVSHHMRTLMDVTDSLFVINGKLMESARQSLGAQ